MKSLIEHLCSPFLVAHFQRICGVEWADPDERNPLMPSANYSLDETPAFVIKNRFLYYAFQLGSQLAGEPFYYVFLPVCSWMLDIAVARKSIIKLAMVMYIGQSTKDILRRTRPPSPPVIRLEKIYETEYGMPSTHTMAGTVAPFSLVLFSRQIYDIPVGKCMVAASMWMTYVGLSRIYLGMHTVWQVLVGAIGSGILLQHYIPVVNDLDVNLLTSRTATACFIAGSLVLTWVMFQLDSGLDPETGKPRWNSARGDTAEIMGVCAGFLTGSRWSIRRSLYLYRVVGTAVVPLPKFNYCHTLKIFAFGGLVLIPIFIVRSIFLNIFIRISGTSSVSRQEARKNPKVELPYKYASGFVATLLSTSLVPFVLNKLRYW